MKKFFKKSLNILMALMTLVNMFIEPICVLASEPVKGDLAYGDQYVRENNGSVNVVDGAFVNEGDVEVRKTVTKLDSNGNYEVKFEVRGKNYSKTTTNTKDIYAVIVFDRSNSMTEGNNKWSNAKNAARAFAEGLIEKYSKANIAVVTFGTTAKTTQEFTNSNLKNISDNKLFGEEPNDGQDGATNLHAGLEKAKSLLSNIDNGAKKYVVVISDGAPTKYKVNGSGGNGRTTSYNCIDKAVVSANDLKGSGAEIFTVGYDLSSEIIYKGKDKTDFWGNVTWTDPYKNSTAESILKLIATDDSHYVSSDQDNIVDKLKDIASSTTVYSPAGTNLTITDNIGSSFTSSDDTDNDGKIVLNTVKKITEEWQEAGRFNITINENSTTDWHNTNDNFSYSYTDNISSKEVNKTCTKNPAVYWVQPEYGYTIEYYYSNVKDESKTVTGSSHEGETVFVTDEMIEANNKTGYKSVNVIPKSKSIEIKKDTSLNVIKVYYDIDATQLKTLKYTVRYFKDGVLQEKDTINKTKTVQVLEPNYINVDLNEINTTNMYTGYKFDHSKPAVIPASVETGTVIDIYYVKDDSQKVEVKYTVEYYVDGVKQENDTQVGRKDIWVNATKELEVNPNHINTTNKYTGYKF
ncbi:MAG: VWA domain-containing protein, partial [Firmicutes bacterium]|nr:VWA domain-containing protein [Bacillota bacterium]